MAIIFYYKKQMAKIQICKKKMTGRYVLKGVNINVKLLYGLI